MVSSSHLAKGGHDSQAEAGFRAILNLNKDYHPAWAALGLLLAKVGQLEAACEAMGTAAKLCPQNGPYSRSLGELCRRQGKTEQAVAVGRKAIALLPTDVGAFYNLGLALTDAGFFAEAAETYRQALVLNPSHGLSWNNLGAALERLEDFTAASTAYAEAIRLNPQHKEAQHNLLQLQRTSRLQHRPEDASTTHQLAVLAWQEGRCVAAIKLLEHAIALDESNAVYCSNLAEMYRQSGRPTLAIDWGERAVALSPDRAISHANLGIAYFNTDNHDAAEACQHRALALAPGLVIALNNLGSIARAQGKPNEAADLYRQALAAQPDHPESLSNLAAVLLEQGKAQEGERYAEAVYKLTPTSPEALCNLGLIRLQQERIEEAEHLLLAALEIKEGYTESLLGLAGVRREQQRYCEARAILEPLLERQPDSVEAWCQLGLLELRQANTDASERAFQQALQLRPNTLAALCGLSDLRIETGQLEEAGQFLEQALTIDPDNLGARLQLIQARKVAGGVFDLDALETQASSGQISDTQKVALHYALGKAYDDLQEWNAAFPHFLAGARLKRKHLTYDAEAENAKIDRLIELTTPTFLAQLRMVKTSDPLPVFVLGMPRSGTTLTEQILASHPNVHGAGELKELAQVLFHDPDSLAGTAHFPNGLGRLTPEHLEICGQRYLERLRTLAPSAQRITDKMPGNYMLLGLIPLMLPGARIIHVKRNPMDTCVSCFTRLFLNQQEATYDLRELGQHYANYARLMDHWRQVLPVNSFLEVQYEDIVADMECQARRLIDWVGLPWSPECLNFHETERSVRTASVLQVRQPIYGSSVARWRHYERFLDPLRQGLGNYAAD